MKYQMKKFIFLTLVSIAFSGILNAQYLTPEDSINRADEEVNLLFGVQKYGRFVGNTSVIKGADLESYPAIMINEALVGRLPGVFMQQNSAAPGEDNFSIYVRGHTGGYIMLVDGVERDLTSYDVEQIEDVRVLKDAVSKAMYGGRTCNGIIMVTTKRGRNATNEFKINYRQGWKTPTVLPKYLNAYDYAVKLNEALDNDGIFTGGGRSSAEALEAYKTGSKPLQYPDVDYYGQFLNDFMNISRVNVEYFGGNEKVVFFIHGGYQKEGGLETYGNKKTENKQLTLQGNLDIKYSDYISLSANIAGFYTNKQYPGAGFNFSTLSTRFPNAYPIFVGTKGNRRDSVGGASGMIDNPYALQALGGYTIENHAMVQGDIGLKFKLDKLLKGLLFTPVYSYDIYQRQDLTKIHRPAIYSVGNFDASGNPQTYTVLQAEQLATSQSMGADLYRNRWAFSGTLSLARQFGDHALNADAVFYMSRLNMSGELFDYKRQNLGLRVNYTFGNRYTAEGVINYCGSQNYAPDNRFKLFPAFGAGWLISEEAFVKDISWINFLKLNASWGIMGDGNIYRNMWRETWYRNAAYAFTPSTTGNTPYLSTVTNNALNWPKMREIDVSIEATVFNKFTGKFTYFDYLQYDQTGRRNNYYPSIIGSSYFIPETNFGQTGLKGTEIELRYINTFSDVKLNVGAHFTYSKSEILKNNELPDPNYTQIGTPADAIWGYRSNGVYTQSEIDQIKEGTSNLALPSYMDPKDLKAGNIKYANLNNDQTLDKYDTEIIGNSTPRLMYGLDANLKYKWIEVYFLFAGYGKYDCLLNSSYYQIYSNNRKYSNVLIDGLPNGNPHPMLTTGSATNDMQSSDYWIVDGSYLKLRNAAITFALPHKWIQRLYLKEAKISLYGNNLLSFSKIKATDPESWNAGISGFPLFRTYALGLSVTF